MKILSFTLLLLLFATTELLAVGDGPETKIVNKKLFDYNELKSSIKNKNISNGILFIQKNKPTEMQLAPWSSYGATAWIEEIKGFEDGIYICQLQNNTPVMSKIQPFVQSQPFVSNPPCVGNT